MMSLFEKNGNGPFARDLFGLHFPNPFGSAPGADPAALKYTRFSHFAFVEIGPVTSVSESGTTPASLGDKVRARVKALLGIPAQSNGALSVKEAIAHLKERKPGCLIAANLAPSRMSISGEAITRDIAASFNYMYDFADMFIIDTFRKNADGTVPLQDVELLSEVLDTLLKMRISNDTVKPIALRVENTIQEQNLVRMLDYMRYSGVDAIIAGIDSHPIGLVRKIVELTQNRYPVIACGDITTAAEAGELLDAGACLLQINGDCRKILKTLEKNLLTK